ncbi:MAG: PIN/TRAM domain-containing protein [Blastocatellia bacterium]|jgi:uncharacterized protein YacL
MRFDVTLIRIVFFATLVSAGYYLRPFDKNPILSAVVGAAVALFIIFFETRIRKATLKTLLGGAVGSVVGIAGATLICWIISAQTAPGIEPEFKSFLTLTVTLFMGYVGLVVGAVKGDYLDLAALGGIFVEKGASKAHSLILDTSVIIDGRVADIAETGFLAGTLVIPQFVLRELQQIADSADSIKRNRGRRGLDILQRLQKKKGSYEIVISEADFPDVREVDHKLIELAKQIEGKIVTNDFNLNKVAQLRGVSVLNINELANALKPVVLPGEIMRVFVLKEGKEYNQGVAYLDDGTMVVVDNARRMIGKNVDVSVTSVLQTTAGKMIFGRFNEDGRPAPAPRHSTSASQ